MEQEIRGRQQSQTITIDPQPATEPQDDIELDDSSIFISNSSMRDLEEAMRKMKQYQREYWMEFAAQRGMSFTSEPGPSDREPEPPPDDDPPMRWDSVIPPKKIRNQRSTNVRESFNARTQRVQAPVSRIPRIAPVPRIQPLKLEPIQAMEEEEEEGEYVPSRPIIHVPKLLDTIPERKRLISNNTHYESQMLNQMSNRLNL